MTQQEVSEMRLAYDEWRRYEEAHERWKKHHNPRDPFDVTFDRDGYIEKRRDEIEEDM